LCLGHQASRAFTPEDEQLLGALCGQVGRIYENGYFYVIARSRAEQLEREMQERERVTAELAAVEQRTRFALEAAGIGVSDFDYETGSLRWSDILERLHGLPAGSFGGSFEESLQMVHPDDVDGVRAALSGVTPKRPDYSVAYRALWPDGSAHWIQRIGRVFFDEAGKPVRRLGVGVDVTAQRQLMDQFQQAQKMEAVGRLAGGIAHDFNNLLTAILGYCQLLEDALEPAGEVVKGGLEEIRKAGERAAGLTRQLLAFSRRQVLQPRVIDLNLVVTVMTAMLRRLIGEDVALTLALSSRPALVRADQGQIEQVIMNLVLNARDAMSAGGAITISTAETAGISGAEVPVDGPPSTGGTYATIAISDTGVGMTAETRGRLFEPFFTTKPPGQGTGLGLATVYGIVKQSGGHVAVRSEPAQGTSFTVFLPAVGNAAEARIANTGPAPGSRGETVLIVEDEAAVRQLTHVLLERAGYRVLDASGSAQAWEVVSNSTPQIDLILTDVVMPGQSGPAMFADIRKAHPGIRVCYMSGYTDDAIAKTGVLGPGVHFLEKPFTPESLRRKVRETLDA
jgi:signal transduction histidine kinase/CheY-like chemotaxis protein